MRAARYGILRDALSRSEVAADKIVSAIPRRRDDDAAAIHAADRRDIRSKLAHDLRALEQSDIVESIGDNLDRDDAERCG